MEEELSQLSNIMDKITTNSEMISKSLSIRRSDLAKLSATDAVLKKLQFLFDLPPRIKSFIDEKKYTDAVNYYSTAKKTFETYSHFPSIKVINQDCLNSLNQLKAILYQQLASNEVRLFTVNLNCFLNLKSIFRLIFIRCPIVFNYCSN